MTRARGANAYLVWRVCVSCMRWRKERTVSAGWMATRLFTVWIVRPPTSEAGYSPVSEEVC